MGGHRPPAPCDTVDAEEADAAAAHTRRQRTGSMPEEHKEVSPMHLAVKLPLLHCGRSARAVPAVDRPEPRPEPFPGAWQIPSRVHNVQGSVHVHTEWPCGWALAMQACSRQ